MKNEEKRAKKLDDEQKVLPQCVISVEMGHLRTPLNFNWPFSQQNGFNS